MKQERWKAKLKEVNKKIEDRVSSGLTHNSILKKNYYYLTNLVDYLKKYGHFDTRAITEYIYNNSDNEVLNYNSIDYLNRTYLGVNTKYKYTQDVDSTVKSIDNYNYIQDDYDGTAYDWLIVKRRKKLDEEEDYLYF